LIKRGLAVSIENKRRAQIGLRYGPKDMDQYYKVQEIAKEIKKSLSATGKFLIAKGIEYRDNPGPLIKEKVVYRDREVPIEKVVYRSEPKGKPHLTKSEHIREGKPHLTKPEHIRGDDRNSQQRALSAKLTTGDKADPPSSPKGNTALGEKKADTKSNGLGWLVGICGIGLVVYLIYKSVK